MVERHTVNVIDTTGDEPSIKRSNSYTDLDDAINAVETLADFADFDTETIELGGGDSIRAWLDSLEADAESRRKTDHYWTPSEGDTVKDPESPHWSTGRAEVIEVTDIPADGFDLPLDSPYPTVADANPEYPEDSPVIRLRYLRKNGDKSKVYALPVSRIEHV